MPESSNRLKMSAQFPPIVDNVEPWMKNKKKRKKKSLGESTGNAGKRRCVHFPVKDKLWHVKRLERGESAKVIARELGLSPATVRRWRSHRDELAKVDDTEHRKRLRTGANPRLDEAVYLWFQKRRAEGVTVSGAILKGKATELNERMGGDGKFNASDGWLTRWRYRHGIKRGISENEKGPIAFEEKFAEMLERQMNLTSSQVFNVAVTTLNAKSMPGEPTRTWRNGFACGNDRVTIMTCANADASLKLRPLVVGKSAQPRGLKNVQRLAIPVCYAHDANAAMNPRIFGDWFVNEFSPTVSQFLLERKIQPRALLLLDETDPIVPDLAIGQIKTMLVPAGEKLSATMLKHRVTRDLKKHYRLSLLESASNARDKGHDPVHHVKTLAMKDLVFRLDDAWNRVSARTIVDAWNNILPPLVPVESDPLAIDDQPELDDSANLARRILGNEDITDEEIDLWLNGSESLEAAGSVAGSKETIEAFECGDENAESGPIRDAEEKDAITPGQAVEALDSVIKFFELDGRLSSVELAALRRARDLALSAKTPDR